MWYQWFTWVLDNVGAGNGWTVDFYTSEHPNYSENKKMKCNVTLCRTMFPSISTSSEFSDFFSKIVFLACNICLNLGRIKILKP